MYYAIVILYEQWKLDPSGSKDQFNGQRKKFMNTVWTSF